MGPIRVHTLLLQQALHGTACDHLCLLHGIIDAGLGLHTVVLQDSKTWQPANPTSRRKYGMPAEMPAAVMLSILHAI
jgi:hypothetical protein